MKCPFCGQELDTDYHYISCRNPHCNITVDMDGTEEMWDALIRARKALKIAVDTLKYENKCIKGGCIDWITHIDTALQQITVLEPKETTNA